MIKLSNENKKQIMHGFIKIFTRISNEEYQKRVWIKAEGPEWDDFDDTYCDFFQQGDPILENYKDFGITNTQYRLLIKFRNAFKAFPEKHELSQNFTATHDWKKIMVMAKEILKAFNYQI